MIPRSLVSTSDTSRALLFGFMLQQIAESFATVTPKRWSRSPQALVTTGSCTQRFLSWSLLVIACASVSSAHESHPLHYNLGWLLDVGYTSMTLHDQFTHCLTEPHCWGTESPWSQSSTCLGCPWPDQKPIEIPSAELTWLIAVIAAVFDSLPSATKRCWTGWSSGFPAQPWQAWHHRKNVSCFASPLTVSGISLRWATSRCGTPTRCRGLVGEKLFEGSKIVCQAKHYSHYHVSHSPTGNSQSSHSIPFKYDSAILSRSGKCLWKPFWSETTHKVLPHWASSDNTCLDQSGQHGRSVAGHLPRRKHGRWSDGAVQFQRTTAVETRKCATCATGIKRQDCAMRRHSPVHFHLHTNHAIAART